MKRIARIEGGHKRVGLPPVRKGFFYKPLHDHPETFTQSIPEFDKACNEYLEHRYRNREREELQLKKSRMAPDDLLAMAIRQLSESCSMEEKRTALDDISDAFFKAASISSAISMLEAMKEEPDIWHIAASILADHYVKRDDREKVIELLDDQEPAVRMMAIESLASMASKERDVSFYVGIVYKMMEDGDEYVADAAAGFLVTCALSSNPALRKAFLDLRSDIFHDMISKISRSD